MELANCTGVTLFILFGIFIVCVALAVSEKCKNKRIKAMIPKAMLFCVIGVIGFGYSSITFKPCGEEDSVTRVIEKVSPKLAVVVPCDCVKTLFKKEMP